MTLNKNLSMDNQQICSLPYLCSVNSYMLVGCLSNTVLFGISQKNICKLRETCLIHSIIVVHILDVDIAIIADDYQSYFSYDF